MTGSLKTDLYLEGRGMDTLFSDRTYVDIKIEKGDIALVFARENLAQAVSNRLLTRLGELSDLGHPYYGSRLYQLIGEPNSQRTQALAEFYIREALLYEDRIEEILDIIIAPHSKASHKRNIMAISVVIMPKDDENPLTISIDYNL